MRLGALFTLAVPVDICEDMDLDKGNVVTCIFPRPRQLLSVNTDYKSRMREFSNPIRLMLDNYPSDPDLYEIIWLSLKVSMLQLYLFHVL